MGEFVVRHIPDDVHTTWKTLSAFRGLTMSKYCLKALRNQLSKDMKAMIAATENQESNQE